MATQDRLQTVRDCYRAYELQDRPLIDWPTPRSSAGSSSSRLVESGDNVFVTYESTRADGKRFRNTEVMTFGGDQVRQIEVYFGWDLD